MDLKSFPRTSDIPGQSPIFWVQQKDRYLRQLLIADIEVLTKRDLIVYFSDCSSTAQIDLNDERYLNELLGKVGTAEFDLFLETNGGITNFAENIVSTLRNYGKKFRVIVPSRAKSNGTLVALAAESIIMGANSELGPIDPSFNGIPCTFIVEIAKTDPTVDKVLLQNARHAIEQSTKIAENLLTNGMMKGVDAAKISDTVGKLASRDHYHSHGSVIDQLEASALGLNIEFLQPDDELWRKIWLLRCCYAYDAGEKKVSKIFESTRVSHSLQYPAATP